MVTTERHTLVRRRDAVLTTYQECQHAATRAALVALFTTSSGSRVTDERVWDHVTYFDWPTTGGEMVEFDWRAIDAERTWSTSEAVIVRAAAALSDYAASVSTPATIADLGWLDERNFDAMLDALREARSSGPSPHHRDALARAFNHVIDLCEVA